jgi:hypothetical protein
MTPLIRETIAWTTRAGMDPTELQWFDISGLMADQVAVNTDALMTCRPPFGRCFVVSRGPSKSHASYDVMAVVAGDDPHKGILIDMWKGPTGKMPRKIPTMLYTIEGNRIMYGPTEEDDPVPEEEAHLVLGVLARWYHSMMATRTAYQPFVRPTFTNQRKIAEGKKPTYDWRTVVIDGTAIKCERNGGAGTRSSPRMHDRRGHSRRLPDGRIVWVRPCKVGDASRGVVFHDYQVKEQR